MNISPRDATEPAAPTRLWVHLTFWLSHAAVLTGLGLLFHGASDFAATLAVFLMLAAMALIVAFCVAVGYYMTRLGRSGIAWGGLAFITSPVGVWATYAASFFVNPVAQNRS